MSVDPPVLECGECEVQWTDGGPRNSIAYAVIQSRSQGWGFLRSTSRVRRCGACNEKHCDGKGSESPLQLGTPSRTRRRKAGLR